MHRRHSGTSSRSRRIHQHSQCPRNQRRWREQFSFSDESDLDDSESDDSDSDVESVRKNDDGDDDESTSPALEAEDVDEPPAIANSEKKWPAIRKEIIIHLQNEGSEINLQILTLKTTKTEKCTKIWEMYAPHIKKTTVVSSLMKLLLQQQRKEGPFSEGANNSKNGGKPLWRSKKKTSAAWGLLYKLRLYTENGTGIDRMSTDEIYKIHKIFHQYDLEDFKVYDKKMVELTDRDRRQTDEEVELFRQHCSHCTKRSVTSRGKPFWQDHAANKQLRDDTRSGKAKQMKPKKLWESNIDYQVFSLEDFRKHVYQERYRQLAGPYWQKKRNKAALKAHEDEVQRLHNECLHNKYEGDMNEIVEGLQNV